MQAASVESNHIATPSGSNSELPLSPPPFAIDHGQRLHHNDETCSTSKSPSHSPQFSRPGSFSSSSTPAAYDQTYEASPSLDDESLDSAVLNSPIQPLPPVLKSRYSDSPPLSESFPSSNSFCPPRRARYLVQPIPLESPFAPPGTLNC